MKITVMKCPYCGGSLDVDKEGPVECKFCHNTFYAEEDKAPVTMNTTINNYNGPAMTPAYPQSLQDAGPASVIGPIIGGLISAVFVIVAIVASVAQGSNYKTMYSETMAATEPATVAPDYWSTQPEGELSVIEASGADEVWTSNFSTMAPSVMTGISISGVDGQTDISWLSKCTSLKELVITDADNVTDWSVLTKLAGIRTIKISSATGLTDINWIRNMPNLKDIELTDTGVTDISVLSGRISILTLTLSGNQIEDYTPVASLSSLTTLTVDEGTELPDLSGLKLLGETIYN